MPDTERMSEERLADLHDNCPKSRVLCLGSSTAWTAIERELIDALRAERALLTAYTTLGTPEEFAALKREHEAVKAVRYVRAERDGQDAVSEAYSDLSSAHDAVEEATK